MQTSVTIERIPLCRRVIFPLQLPHGDRLQKLVPPQIHQCKGCLGASVRTCFPGQCLKKPRSRGQDGFSLQQKRCDQFVSSYFTNTDRAPFQIILHSMPSLPSSAVFLSWRLHVQALWQAGGVWLDGLHLSNVWKAFFWLKAEAYFQNIIVEFESNCGFYRGDR